MANNEAEKSEKSEMPPPELNEKIVGEHQYQSEFGDSPASAWSHPPTHLPTSPVVTAYDSGQSPRAMNVIVARPPSLKTLPEAYLLWFPLGLIGLHHFYLRRYAFGLLYLFTGGLLGVGWIVDAFRMPLLVRDANRRIQRGPANLNEKESETDNKKSIIDAYILWFPLGIIGLHHYYLRRPAWGVAYTFTFGLLGIGWLIDAFRIPGLVSEANERLARQENVPSVKTVGNAYVLGATPAGLFGAHHFYLGRIPFGIYYMLTLGGFGIGWIVDLFRMPWLVERANNVNSQFLGTRHKYVDDAYVMAFPGGFLGIHHFYLERPCWGMLYLFTGGLFGVGWLVDLCRMPCLVAEANKRLTEEATMMYEVRDQMGGAYTMGGNSGIVVIPQYHQSAAAIFPKPQTSIVIDPSTLGYNGPNSAAASSLDPPPYNESLTTMSYDQQTTRPTVDQPPAYYRYGSMDDVEKKQPPPE